MSTTTEVSFKSISTISLPASIRKLIKLTGKRPSAVELTLQNGPAHYVHTYRTQTAVSLGEEIARTDTSSMGSDGEWNSSTEVFYTSALVVVRSPWRSGQAPLVEVVLGGFTTDELEALEARFPTRLKVKALTASEVAVLVDRSLSADFPPYCPLTPAEVDAKGQPNPATEVADYAAEEANEHNDMLAALGLMD